MKLRIKDLREDHDLTQAQLDKILNCSQQTYSRYETGEISISVESLIILDKFYHTNLDYLVYLTNHKNNQRKK